MKLNFCAAGIPACVAAYEFSSITRHMKKLLFLFILVFCFALSDSFGQFEGRIQFKSYEVESGEKELDEDDGFTLLITPDRMLLQGESRYKVGGALETEGILIRHNEKDFVFLTGERRAMRITKAGITSFMNMFGSDARGDVAEAEQTMDFRNTGEQARVQGYAAEKFVITDSDEPNEHSEVWMTRELDINWGILAEPWGDNMKGFAGSDLPLSLFFEDGYFPVKWEHYKNDELTSVTEVEVTPTAIERSMVDIESNVEIVSLQDYLFQQARDRQ